MIASRWALINALLVAAEVFERDAALNQSQPKLAEQFTRQAREARALAQQIEQADSIKLTDRS